MLLEALEGNEAETKAMLPVIRSFMGAHQLADVTIVADAGMVSEANRGAIEDAGLSYIIGARIYGRAHSQEQQTYRGHGHPPL